MYKWTTKTGKKPPPEAFKAADDFAKRGSHAHMVVAMAMRPDGLTQQEVITLLGHPYRNKLKKLVQDNKVRQVEIKQPVRVRLLKR